MHEQHRAQAMLYFTEAAALHTAADRLAHPLLPPPALAPAQAEQRQIILAIAGKLITDTCDELIQRGISIWNEPSVEQT